MFYDKLHGSTPPVVSFTHYSVTVTSILLFSTLIFFCHHGHSSCTFLVSCCCCCLTHQQQHLLSPFFHFYYTCTPRPHHEEIKQETRSTASLTLSRHSVADRTTLSSGCVTMFRPTPWRRDMVNYDRTGSYWTKERLALLPALAAKDAQDPGLPTRHRP